MMEIVKLKLNVNGTRLGVMQVRLSHKETSAFIILTQEQCVALGSYAEEGSRKAGIALPNTPSEFGVERLNSTVPLNDFADAFNEQFKDDSHY